MIANYHAHTWRCHHADGIEEDYVRHGIDRGLKIIGFSDHTPYPFPDGYVSTFRMNLDQLQDYVDTITSLQRKYSPQTQILLGLEAEFYPALFSQLLSILRDHPVDYLLLGQHNLGNEIGEHYNGRPTGDPELLRRYCYQTAQGMNTGLFTYLAHPDLFYFTGDTSLYRRYMRQLCVEANGCGIPLELNLLGLAQGRHYPNEEFWRIAAEENCAVVLGCDAHSPQAMSDTEPEKKAMELVHRMGLRLLERVDLRRP